MNLPQPWTPSQRRALWVFLAAMCACLAVKWACNRQYISDSPDVPPPRAGELEDRLDPNQADWQSLAAIPELGEKRAQAIVAYRETFIRSGRGPIAFHTPTDLLRVKGIGASTVSNIEPYLMFPPQARQNQ